MSRATEPEACAPEENLPDDEAEQAPSAEDVIHALIGTAHVIERAFDARLAKFKLPVRLSGPRLHILIAVEHAKRLRMGDVAAALGITPRTVTTLVDGIERDGLIKRVLDPKDRRATLLELTPLAQEHFAQVRALQKQLTEDISCGLDGEQRCQLLDLLCQLRESVNSSTITATPAHSESQETD